MQIAICESAIPGSIPGALFKVSASSGWIATKKDLALTIVPNICRNVFLSGNSMYNSQHIVKAQWMPNRRISRRQRTVICWACICSTQCPKVFSAALCLLFRHTTVNLTINSLILLHSTISPLQLVKITEMYMWNICHNLKPCYIQMLYTGMELFSFHK